MGKSELIRHLADRFEAKRTEARESFDERPDLKALKEGPVTAAREQKKADRKFQFVMGDALWNVLEDLRVRTERASISEVIRDAVKAYEWMVTEYEGGREVMSQEREVGSAPFRPSLSTKTLVRGGRK